MTLEQLAMFVAACETGSINQAAELVFASRQAVSRALASLESELGISLLVRTAKGVGPTDAGADVLVQAKIMLQARDRMLVRAREDAHPHEERLRVGLAYGVAGVLSSSAISRFKLSYPHIEVDFEDDTDEGVETKALNGTYDLCFAVEPVNRSKFAVFPLFSEAVYVQVYAGHDLFDRQEITIDDLRSRSYVVPGPRQKCNRLFGAWCEEAGLNPFFLDTHGIHEFSALENIALREKALFSAPESIAILDRPHVKSFPFPIDPPRWEVSIAVPRCRAITPGVAAFAEFFVREYEGRDLSVSESSCL